MFNHIRRRRADARTVRLIRRPRLFDIPEIYEEFIGDEKNQWVVFKGGRAGYKTHSFARAIVEYSYTDNPGDVSVFAREISVSLSDSIWSTVKKLIGAIEGMTCNHCTEDGSTFTARTSDFKVMAREIINLRSGARLIPFGLRITGGETSTNQSEKIKGLTGVVRIMLEEASTVTIDALSSLEPTLERSETITAVNSPAHDVATAIGKDVRWFVAMNPNRPIDPIIGLALRRVGEGRGVIVHVNMTDIGGELGDKETGLVRNATITVNGEPRIIQTTPHRQDVKATRLMEDDRTEQLFEFEHVWLGEPKSRFSGLAFAKHKSITGVSESEIQIYTLFIDPSGDGTDSTAIALFGRNLTTGRFIAFGKSWQAGWADSRVLLGIEEAINKYNPGKVWTEKNGLGYNLAHTLRACGLQASEWVTGDNKENRIYAAAGATVYHMDILEDFCGKEWLREVREWSREMKHDDCPDSLASSIISSGYVQIGSIFSKK